MGIPHIEKAIRLSPRDPRVSATQYGLWRCHLLIGHLNQAIELFDRVRAVSPRCWEVHVWLAGALGLKGDLDAAKAELAEATTLKPELGSLLRWGADGPWITNPEYRALREKTLNVGLRRAGMTGE
jgi:adenylate cyclase